MSYQPLKIGCDQKYVPQVAKENAFKEDLKTLFDVASANALRGQMSVITKLLPPSKHGVLLRKLLVCRLTQLPHT